MFFKATVFNRPLNSWNTSSVVDFTSTFEGAKEFHRDLDSWDVSKVKSFHRTFHSAASFNGNVTTWATSSAKLMSFMVSVEEKRTSNTEVNSV
jgi:hypothetical protein